jgi:hypothetical protein
LRLSSASRKLAHSRGQGPRTCVDGTPQRLDAANKANPNKTFVLPSDLDPDPTPKPFAQACKFGLEGIVSKRRDLAYESGKSRRWLKIKNPHSPAMLRLQD